MESPQAPIPSVDPPPRAFAQGVGTVFQVAGVLVFLYASFSCCGSGLLSREWATQFTNEGLHVASGAVYSIARAITISVFAAVFFGVATATMGLGLQAEHRGAPLGAAGVSAIALLFFAAHTWFVAAYVHSALLLMTFGVATVLFAVLFALAVGAWRDMLRNPPPPEHDVLPADYKIPYSHYHADPPEVRLAAELEQRRQRLAVQQKEVEMLEEKLKRKLEAPDGD
jgi:hypothetical protein